MANDPVIVYVTIEGETIITTPEHPFYTEEGEWLTAVELQNGDEIRNEEWKTDTVQSIHFLAKSQTMYNLTVDTAHTFFVGNEQWLVHNSFCDWWYFSGEIVQTVGGRGTPEYGPAMGAIVDYSDDGRIFQIGIYDGSGKIVGHIDVPDGHYHDFSNARDMQTQVTG